MSAYLTTVDGSSWSGVSRERRDSKRYNLLRSATVYRSDGRHVGVVRNVSEDGLLFYAVFIPTLGEQLRIIVDGTPRAIRLTGTVARVEYHAVPDTVGIAVRINDSFLSSIEDVVMSSATLPKL